MKNIIIAAFFIILGVWGCSSNPVKPVPAYVGVYQGMTSVNDSVSFTVSDIEGTAFVTSYFLKYYISFNESGTKRETNSSGIAQLNGSTIEISLGLNPDEKFTGTFSDNTKLNGNYNYMNSPGTYAAGSFSLTKAGSN